MPWYKGSENCLSSFHFPYRFHGPLATSSNSRALFPYAALFGLDHDKPPIVDGKTPCFKAQGLNYALQRGYDIGNIKSQIQALLYYVRQVR
jgi:hypothetical protein